MTHMSAEEFRARGHEVIDWIADYWASLDDLPVRPTVTPGSVAAALPGTMFTAGATTAAPALPRCGG